MCIRDRNDTSTLANATGKKFTVTTGTNDNMTVQVGSGTATEITIAAGTYTTNANLVTAINTALSNASIAATAIWTGSAYAFKDSGNVGNITISSVDASLDSHMKISANYGAGNSSGGAASTGYGGIFSNIKSS